MEILKEIEHTNVETAKYISQEKTTIPTQPMSQKTKKEENNKENFKSTSQNKSHFSIVKIKEETHDIKISKFSYQEKTQSYISKKTENKNDINTTKPSQEKNQSISLRNKEEKNNMSTTGNIQTVTPKTKADDLSFLKKLKSPETTNQSYISPIISKKKNLPFFIRHVKNKEDSKIAEVLVYKLGSQSTPRKIRKNKHFNSSPRKKWGTPESDFYTRARSLKNMVTKCAINKRVIRKKKIEVTPVPFVKPVKIQHPCNNKYKQDSNSSNEQTNSSNKPEESIRVQSVKSLVNLFEKLSNDTDSNTSKIKDFAFKRVPQNKEIISSESRIIDSKQTMEIKIESKSNIFNQNSIVYNTSKTFKPEVVEETRIHINENDYFHNNDSNKIWSFISDADLTQKNADVKDPLILSTNSDNITIDTKNQINKQQETDLTQKNADVKDPLISSTDSDNITIDTQNQINKQQETVPDVNKNNYLEKLNINECNKNDHTTNYPLKDDSNNLTLVMSSDINSTQRNVEVKRNDPVTLSDNNEISIKIENQGNKNQEPDIEVDKRDYVVEPKIDKGKHICLHQLEVQQIFNPLNHCKECQQLVETEENGEDSDHENVLSLFSVPEIKKSSNRYSLESEQDKNDIITSHNKTDDRKIKYFIKVLEEDYNEFPIVESQLENNCHSTIENISITDHSIQNGDYKEDLGTQNSENFQFDGLNDKDFPPLVSPGTLNENISVSGTETLQNVQIGGLKDEDFPPLVSPGTLNENISVSGTETLQNVQIGSLKDEDFPPLVSPGTLNENISVSGTETLQNVQFGSLKDEDFPPLVSPGTLNENISVSGTENLQNVQFGSLKDEDFPPLVSPGTLNENISVSGTETLQNVQIGGLKDEDFPPLVSPGTLNENISGSGTGTLQNVQFGGLKDEDFPLSVSPGTLNNNKKVSGTGTLENLQFGGIKDEDFPPLISPEKNTVFID